MKLRVVFLKEKVPAHRGVGNALCAWLLQGSAEGASHVVLGATLGDASAVGAAMDATVSQVSVLHDKIHDLSDPAAELALLRQCADVSKAMYTLWTQGDSVPEVCLRSGEHAWRPNIGPIMGSGTERGGARRSRLARWP